MKRIAIIDYGAGNLHSVRAGVARVAASGDEIQVTDDNAIIEQATHIILPGVGAFGDCIAALKAKEGLIALLEQQVHQKHIPFLGICVGMQMLLERGYEHGKHEGLGWIKGEVVAIKPDDASLKVPHMGWNELSFKQASHPIAEGLSEGCHAYFVHSYMVHCTNPSNIIAITQYGSDVAAIIGSKNIVGTQFHPEKSQHIGATILENFLKMV